MDLPQSSSIGGSNIVLGDNSVVNVKGGLLRVPNWTSKPEFRLRPPVESPIPPSFALRVSLPQSSHPNHFPARLSHPPLGSPEERKKKNGRQSLPAPSAAELLGQDPPSNHTHTPWSFAFPPLNLLSSPSLPLSTPNLSTSSKTDAALALALAHPPLRPIPFRRLFSLPSPVTMNSQGPNDVSPEAMQARIQQARREAETLKDRIKRKKDELADTTRM